MAVVKAAWRVGVQRILPFPLVVVVRGVKDFGDAWKETAVKVEHA